MMGSPAPCDHLGRSQLPEIQPLLAHEVDKHEVTLLVFRGFKIVQRACFESGGCFTQ